MKVPQQVLFNPGNPDCLMKDLWSGICGWPFRLGWKIPGQKIHCLLDKDYEKSYELVEFQSELHILKHVLQKSEWNFTGIIPHISWSMVNIALFAFVIMKGLLTFDQSMLDNKEKIDDMESLFTLGLQEGLISSY